MLFSFTNVNGTNVPDWKCAKKKMKQYTENNFNAHTRVNRSTFLKTLRNQVFS